MGDRGLRMGGAAAPKASTLIDVNGTPTDHLSVDATAVVPSDIGAQPAAPALTRLGTSGAFTVHRWTTAQADTQFAIPANCTLVDIRVLAGGPGGGSGRRGAQGTVRSGGSSGGTAGESRGRFTVAELGVTSLYVTVGGGGAGGAAVTTDNTNGNDGAVGASSLVKKASGVATLANHLLTSDPGSVGKGGTATGAAAGSNGNSRWGGANGTAADAAGGNGVGAGFLSGESAQPGGSGGGITAADVVGTAGQCFTPQGYVFAQISTIDPPASPGLRPWMGGNGGAASKTAAAGRGGDGIYGGSGGGGGASLNGFASGRGGNGGAGYVEIVCYYT